jgi:cytochrome c553
MKRVYISMLLAAASSCVMAGGDPAAGQATAIICIGCHGNDGNSINPLNPKLAAQGENYLNKQLTDFKSGARKEQHMSSMVEAIRKEDIPNLAAWFSSQKRQSSPSTKINQQGKQIFHNGIDNKGIAACDGCHAEDGKGNDAIGFPSLAGQHAEYITKQLKEFRSGVRSNDSGMMMRNVAKDLSNQEIDSLTEYIESMF